MSYKRAEDLLPTNKIRQKNYVYVRRNMKKLIIEWKHFDKNGKTCERCSGTGNNLSQVIAGLRSELLQKGVEIEYRKTKLPESRMSESNMILINSVPLEQLISDTKAGENDCCSCSQLINDASSCRCRTVSHKGIVFEEVPKKLIRLAVLKYLNLE